MELVVWTGLAVAVVAAVVALWGARQAQVASRRAAQDAASARQHARIAAQQAATAGQQAAATADQALAVTETVDAAREQLAVARAETGNIGAVDVAWVQQWRHGPVFGLLCLQAVGHHALRDVYLSIVAPRHQVGGVPAVAVLGDSPVDIAEAEQRIGLPRVPRAALPTVLHTEVAVGDLQPGVPWHAVLMCLSEADSIVFIMDWTVGAGRDRERARTDLALPPPRREAARD